MKTDCNHLVGVSAANKIGIRIFNRLAEARDAFNRAIALANSVAEAKLIRRELDGLAIAADADPELNDGTGLRTSRFTD